MADITREKDLISVIVPVWHVEHFLPRCLDSLLAQTYPKIEIILINDGGTEGDTRVCERYAAADPRIVYRYQDNAGLSGARNTALDLARGEWIMFLDSDDCAYPDFCEAALRAVRSDHTEVCAFDLKGGSFGGFSYQDRSQIIPGIYTAEEFLRAQIDGKVRGYIWNKLYHHRLFEDVRFPVGEVWEDDAVLHRLIGAARGVSLIDRMLVWHESRKESITGLAEKDFSDMKWIFIQRKKRYLYFLDAYPALAEHAKKDLLARAYRYGIYYTEVEPDREEVRGAVRWLKEYGIRSSKLRPAEKIMIGTMCHCYPVFAILAHVYMEMRRSGAWDRLKKIIWRR